MADAVEETDVAIVGAGLTGICVAWHLAQRGTPHLVLEKGDSAGGIWTAQRWPGIRCDTDIVKYAYSFAPFLSDRCLVPGAEISRYLQDTARSTGVAALTRFRTTVTGADFDTATARWTIRTDRGLFRARFLVNANGYFAEAPHVPDLPGRGAYRGEVIHLARLTEAADFLDRDVVLVGSGASAFTAAPALRTRCRSLTLLQRSPSYVFEEPNTVGPVVGLAQRLHRRGLAWPLTAVNWLLQLKDDLVFVLFRGAPWFGRAWFRRHWRDAVDGRTWAEHFRPSYGPWAQRIPVAIGLKSLLRSGGLRMVTGRIKTFTPGGVELEDGRTVAGEVFVLATGYDLQFFKFPVSVDGRPVDTDRINFFKGMMMGGIPNWFQPFGAQHTSFTRRVEVVTRLMLRILDHMAARGLRTVMVERRDVPYTLRITPNYVTRELGRLPAIYGSFELPSIDGLLRFGFRRRDYLFQR
jgi:monooxygenase